MQPLRSGRIVLPDTHGFSVHEDSRGALSGRMTISGASIPNYQPISGPPHASLIIRDRTGNRVKAHQNGVPKEQTYQLNGNIPAVQPRTFSSAATYSPVIYDTIPALESSVHESRTTTLDNSGATTWMVSTGPVDTGMAHNHTQNDSVTNEGSTISSTDAAPLPTPLSCNITRITLDETNTNITPVSDSIPSNNIAPGSKTAPPTTQVAPSSSNVISNSQIPQFTLWMHQIIWIQTHPLFVQVQTLFLCIQVQSQHWIVQPQHPLQIHIQIHHHLQIQVPLLMIINPNQQTIHPKRSTLMSKSQSLS